MSEKEKDENENKKIMGILQTFQELEKDRIFFKELLVKLPPAPDLKQIDPETIARFQEASAKLNAALGELAEVLYPVFEQIAIAVGNFASLVVAPFSNAYRNLGSPYGETDDGFLRWFDELIQAYTSASSAEPEENRWKHSNRATSEERALLSKLTKSLAELREDPGDPEQKKNE